MSLSPRFEEAVVFAARLHRSQRRKGSRVPYLSHLLCVASIVIEHGGDEEQAIAALLHDAVEDQGGPATAQKIRHQFGDRVAEIVEACTDTDRMPKPPWRDRKEAFLARLPQIHSSALLVIAADKLCNTRSLLADYRQIGEDLWDRFNGGREGTLWYYQSVAQALSKAIPSPVSADLLRAVADLQHLTQSRFYPERDNPAVDR